ncbi:MAG: YSC84-related protein [Pseudomonadota bacterium]
MTPTRRTLLAGLTAAMVPLSMPALAEDREVIEARVNIAIERLFQEIPGTRELSKRARGMLVMPDVVKGGFIVGGSYGEGALRLNQGGSFTETAEYYSVGAASVGLQAGVQQTSHALFFLTDQALENFRRADGWSIGADAEVTFPDAGFNVGAGSDTLNQPVIGFVFGEDGVLIGASLEGAKYSRIIR